jgi:Mrp family chromosome partitioning ATPase
MDGVLLVGRLDRTDRQALSNAAEQLRRTRTPLLGVIVNGVSPGRRYGGSYGYGYGYGYESNGGPDSVGEPRKRLFGGVFGT